MSVGVETNLVFLCVGDQSCVNFGVGIVTALVFVRGVERDRLFSRGPKMTCFLCMDRYSPGFAARIEIGVLFLRGPRISHFRCGDRLICFYVGGRN